MKREILIAALVTSTAACGVSRKEHEALQAQLEQRNIDVADLEKSKADAQIRMAAEIEELENQIADLRGREGALQADVDELQSELDEAHGTLSFYASETGDLQEALRATREDIDALEAQRTAAVRRLREYRELARRLAAMVESGQLSIHVRNSKMVIEMPNAILFDPGRTDIKPAGRKALAGLAEVLRTVDRSFLVAGHTDNVPIKVSGYTSNWELSTARAAKVLHALQDDGVAPVKLAAAGYGEFDPVASNASEDGRAQNRRTEIVLMPKIDELPKLPEDLFATSS